jgi:acetylglutamate/LysW-gamma-L-alpha-aminoadipate kinase
MSIVIKIGGADGIDPSAVLQDCATLRSQGETVILVHGCSGTTNRLAEELGETVRYLTSTTGVRSRYTNPRMLEIFIMAARSVNTRLVQSLHHLGVNAIGLSGLDGALLRAQRKDALRVVEEGRSRIVRDDYTGRVESVNKNLLQLLLDNGYMPVIAPLALAANSAVNVDGDRVAALVAATLGASTLLILSNVPGMLTDVADPTSRIDRIEAAALSDYDRYASGGMRRKLIGAREALAGGVGRVIIASAHNEHPVTTALQGEGTVIA